MNGFIDHQPFQQSRRRFPGDSFELEKADVEPVGEQTLQVFLEAGEQGVSLAEIEQFGPAVDEELYPFGQCIELA